MAGSVGALGPAQPWLAEGLAALGARPLLVQHAIADQTLEIGHARELTAAVSGASLVEYGAGTARATTTPRQRSGPPRRAGWWRII